MSEFNYMFAETGSFLFKVVVILGVVCIIIITVDTILVYRKNKDINKCILHLKKEINKTPFADIARAISHLLK